MRNLTMMTDLYQLTMMYGYYKHGMKDNIAVFDLFYRQNRDNCAYSVMAGTESAIEYINNLRFTDDDIEYLCSLNLFGEDFLEMLRGFRFTGSIYGMKEGTIVFPREPLLRVEAPIIEAQLVETALLTLVNHQTLIATKANRVCYAANGGQVLEFGLRRAQGADAGIYGARAAMVGGCVATSNVIAGKWFDIPVKGTHAHSWVMSFPTELDAFRAYADVFPDSCMFLVDTYDTIRSGIPNAIKVFDELRAKGYEPVGIRLDSGDLAYLSKKAREMLDDAGYENAKIFVSGDLDERVIYDLRTQGACIDVYGVGTKLITSSDQPALGGVYKMSCEIVDGVEIPKMKLSDNPAKTTLPGKKKVLRLYNKSHKAIADLIALDSEKIESGKELKLFHPEQTYKSMTVRDFTVRDLLVPLFIDGKQVYELPTLTEIQEYARSEMDTLWPESKRLLNPHEYKVDISDRLYDLRKRLTWELANQNRT
ncbi:MAG: nicotinate phosphoribosyltransferase [Eubacteriales bacterium]|nr:nicotinate phosphoribosyltransferase [Eubacteriales bacterium]MCI7571204.1 nicotinate phosphoribosyltransferase [Clostridiales bacterium]MDD7551057.1 nicotinate phosphoribosyltransferase [Clostridia bacterium]MDY5754326.1 nicotinate phosphoribosyltransferase [Eubacteriales bacterium]